MLRDRLAPNDRLLDANGNAQLLRWMQIGPKGPPPRGQWKCSTSSMVTDWPQMAASLMLMEMPSELFGYGLAPNDRQHGSRGNDERALWLRIGPK